MLSGWPEFRRKTYTAGGQTVAVVYKNLVLRRRLANGVTDG